MSDWTPRNPYGAAALLRQAHDETDGAPGAMVAWLAGRAVKLAEDVISLAETAGMPDSYQQTDSRMQRAREVLGE